MLLWEPERIPSALTGEAGSEPWRGTLLGKRACCGLPFASGTFAWNEGRRCGACWRRKQRRCLLGTRVTGGDVVFLGGGCAPERGESRKALSHCRPVRKGKIFQRWSAEAFSGSGGGGRAFCVRLAGRRRFSADIDRERDGWASGGIFSPHLYAGEKAHSTHFLRMNERAFLFRQKLAETNFKTEKLR